MKEFLMIIASIFPKQSKFFSKMLTKNNLGQLLDFRMLHLITSIYAKWNPRQCKALKKLFKLFSINIRPNEDKEMMPEQLFNLVLSETSEKSDIDGPRKRINKREPLNTEESLPVISNKSLKKFFKEDSEGKLKPLFRPFGVLEPNSAKIVRRNIYATFPILCDLANLSAEIKSIHQKIKKMDKIKE